MAEQSIKIMGSLVTIISNAVQFDIDCVFYEGGNILPEGYGVVVIEKDGGEFFAWGDAWDIRRPYESDILRKNFSGARVAYGDKAFLLKIENGVVVKSV